MPDLGNVYFLDIETTGLDPYGDKVVTVQVRHDGRTVIWKEWELGEVGCLSSFFALLNDLDWRQASLIGYNVLKFDIPFIDARLRMLGLMNERAWHLLHDRPHVIDLYQLLGDFYARAKAWYHSMTPVENEVVNAEVPELYNKREYSRIERYIEREMEAMEFLFEEIKREDFYGELVKLRQMALGEKA